MKQRLQNTDAFSDAAETGDWQQWARMTSDDQKHQRIT